MYSTSEHNAIYPKVPPVQQYRSWYRPGGGGGTAPGKGTSVRGANGWGGCGHIFKLTLQCLERDGASEGWGEESGW
eukprot:767526-Hanusia_phi.AAC.1